MTPLNPAPLRNALSGAALPSETWGKWFRDVAALLGFDNNHSRTPDPVFTGLTVVGTVERLLAYVKDRNLVTVTLSFSPSGGGTVAMVAGSTYLSNLPYTPSHEAVGVLVNLSTLAVVGGVHADAGSTRLYLPTLVASNAQHAATITYRTEDA